MTKHEVAEAIEDIIDGIEGDTFTADRLIALNKRILA
jgi:hypothetical protein